MVSNRRHIPSLDGLRAVAILLVFMAHSGASQLIPGGLGVTLFFFLSGYLITTLLRIEADETGTVNLGHFYLRRMLRIWPAFYVVLGVGVLLTLGHWLPGDLNRSAVLAQALHFSNLYSVWVDETGTVIGSAVFWSLALEEHFYLVFPCLFLFLRRRFATATQQAAFLSLVCLATLLWRYALVTQFHVAQNRTYFSTDTRFDSLLLGCILALWHNPVLDKPLASAGVLKHYFVPAGLALLITTLLIRDAVFRETLRYSLQGLALLPLFTAAILLPRWWPFAPLNTHWPRALGRISYPFYLVHLTVIDSVAYVLPNTPVVLSNLMAFAFSIALALALYQGVERPFTRIRKKFA